MIRAALSRPKVISGLLALLLALFAGGVWWLGARNDAIAFLPSQAGAEWIMDAKIPDLKPQPAVPSQVNFRQMFTLETPPAEATVEIRAFKTAVVRINGQVVDGLALNGKGWKQSATAAITPWLRAGTNEILVTVTNVSGPPALWLRLRAGKLALGTDATWQASPVDTHWVNARPAAESPRWPEWAALTLRTTTGEILRRTGVEIALFFAAALALILGVRHYLKRHANRPKDQWIYLVFALVAVARVILFLHDAPGLRRDTGFDAVAHEEYIRYIQEKSALPLPNEGWEMHQPPLYYLLAAGWLEALGHTAGNEDAVLPLRAMNAGVGLLNCWLVLLCLRRLFPGNLTAQAVGLLSASFLPANLSISMYVTNDPLAGLWVTLAFYFFLRLVAAEKGQLRLAAGLGLATGLAILTKFNAVLALPVFLGALGLKVIQEKKPASLRNWRAWGMVILVCAATCGWHYLRVWQQVGTVPLPNSQTAPAAAWWQYPGYRTSSYYWGFGQALVSPLFSGLHSFGDGIYSTLWGDGLISGHSQLLFRPPWNDELMTVAGMISAGLTGLLLVGGWVCLRKFVRTADPVAGMLPGMLLAFAAGILLLTLQGPWLAHVKAFYALPALVSFGALIAEGWGWLVAKERRWQGGLWGLLLVWIATTYSSFWIRHENYQFWRYHAYDCMLKQDWDGATADIFHALQLNPSDAHSRHLLAMTLRQQGQAAEALREDQESLRLAPDSPMVLNDLAQALSTGDKQDQTKAVALAQRACELTAYRQSFLVVTLAETQFRARQIEAGIESYRLAIKLAGNYGETARVENLAITLNNLAWLLATRPENTQRDGDYAVQLAQQACEVTRPEKAFFLGTLAAAYARAGRFDEAVITGKKACALAEANGQPELQKANEDLLKLYQQRQAYQEK